MSQSNWDRLLKTGNVLQVSKPIVKNSHVSLLKNTLWIINSPQNPAGTVAFRAAKYPAMHSRNMEHGHRLESYLFFISNYKSYFKKSNINKINQNILMSRPSPENLLRHRWLRGPTHLVIVPNCPMVQMWFYTLLLAYHNVHQLLGFKIDCQVI